jgi:hypothetical protein
MFVPNSILSPTTTQSVAIVLGESTPRMGRKMKAHRIERLLRLIQEMLKTVEDLFK